VSANLKPNLIDRAVAAIVPGSAVRRAEARLQLQELQMRQGAADGIAQQLNAVMAAPASTSPPKVETRWRGASRMLRSMMLWVPGLRSATSDLPKHERELMAARAHDAYRGHMIARAAISRCKSNIVGTGLMAHAAVDATYLGITDDAADALNAEIDREFAIWADNAIECDWEATLDFYGQQALALASAMLAGDCFALTPEDERLGGQYALKVQLVDAARVCNPDGRSNSPELQDGIKISKAGVPVGAFFRSRHPGDIESGPEPVTWEYRDFYGESGRRRVLQVWNEKDRIGAVRGASYLAPILEPLQQLEQYSRAELTAAVVSALFTVFIKKKTEKYDSSGNIPPPIQGQTVKPGPGQPVLPKSAQAPTPVTPANLELGAGAVVDLAPDEEPHESNPARPNAQFDPFFVSVMKQIGAALEIPVEELLLFYSSSYSAARAAMLQAWRFYVQRRTGLVQQFAAPLRALWFDEAVARGRLPGVTDYADPRRRVAYLNAVWIGPARGAMDEDKEAKAAITRIEGGLSTEAIEIPALMGEPRSAIYNQRLREIKQRRKDGTELGPQPGQAAGPAQLPAPKDRRNGGNEDDPPAPPDRREGGPELPPAPPTETKS
jgi:lambda family phage portal protein